MLSITPVTSSTLRDDCWMFCMVCTTWAIALPPSVATADAWLAMCSARAAVSVDWCRRCVTCSSAAAVCCRLDAVPSVRSDRSALPCAISWAARRTLWADWRTCITKVRRASCMVFRDSSNWPASSRLCPSMFSRRSRLDTRWAVALAVPMGREMLRTSHQVSTLPSSRAVAQNRVSATWARWLLCAIWAPAASIASRCDCASCCNDPSRAAALGSKRSVNTLRMRSVRPKSRAVTSSLTAAWKSCALSCVPVSRACSAGVCRRVASWSISSR